jgi:hypothetical protein
MQRLTPEAPEAAEGAPEPMEEVVEKTTVGEAVTTSPEIALEVAIRSPEIQDAEPIRAAPMTEATTCSRGGIELLADDLIEPAVDAKSALNANHTASRTKLASHAQRAKDVPVNFSEVDGLIGPLEELDDTTRTLGFGLRPVYIEE